MSRPKNPEVRQNPYRYAVVMSTGQISRYWGTKHAATQWAKFVRLSGDRGVQVVELNPKA